MAERYKIYEQLGAGGVGAVFRAYDNELKRWVAIKRLISAKDAAADEKLVADLRREADALASLRNPNIVTIFDVASDGEGMFMVMELLEGEDLADVVERGPLHYDDFKELASQALEGLLAAHQRYILHRDIKPQNIKVERLPGGRMQSKIIDFGLARAGLRARKQTEDQSGTVMGSIHYMAPEQLSRKPVDERTDLYSLGCVFYEALSGRKAFDADNVASMIDKHLNHDLVPLHIIAPHVPAWLGSWVMRLMACKPEDRPQNAQQAIEEFRTWEKMPMAPQMMPWMPMGYMPAGGGYTQPIQPMYGTGGVMIPPGMATGSIPVPGAYYQTGQVVPAQYSTQPVEVVPVAKPIHEIAATTGQISAPSNVTKPVGRSGPAAPAKPVGPQRGAALVAAKKPNPAATSANQPKSKGKLYGMVAAGVVLIGIGVSFLSGGKGDPQAGEAKQGGGTTSSPAVSGGPEDLVFQLPMERQFPPQDQDLVAHYVASSGAVKNGKDSAGKPAIAATNEPIFAWHDLAPRGRGGHLRPPEGASKHSPTRQSWGGEGLKGGRQVLDFRPRNGQPTALQSPGVGSEGGRWPFGVTDLKGSQGCTLVVVFQAESGRLPMRVLSLESDQGAYVQLTVNEQRQVVATFNNGSGGATTITSKDVEGVRPNMAFLSWDAKEGATALRVRDSHGKTFAAQGNSVAKPSSAMTRLFVGRSKGRDGKDVPKEEQFAGWLAELLVYSTTLRADQTQLLEITNLKEWYFSGYSNIKPLPSRLKTKLGIIEPRGSAGYKLTSSHNQGEIMRAVDANPGNRWTSKVNQSPGMWVRLEMPNEIEVAGVVLDTESTPSDYGRGVKVELSKDGSQWVFAAESKSAEKVNEILFSSPIKGRFLRITQTGSDSSKHWGISEMLLLKRSQ